MVSFAGLLVAAGSKAEGLWQRRKRTKLLLAGLRTLSPDEKQLLSSYMTPRTKTRYFDLEDGIAAGLASRGILYRPTAVFDLSEGAAFNLWPSVWNELTEHPELLELTEEDRRALADHPDLTESR